MARHTFTCPFCGDDMGWDSAEIWHCGCGHAIVGGEEPQAHARQHATALALLTRARDCGVDDDWHVAVGEFLEEVGE
jgi:ribosomal protein L37AE/L43A